MFDKNVIIFRSKLKRRLYCLLINAVCGREVGNENGYLGGIKVECVETAPSLKNIGFFFLWGEGSSSTPAGIKALDFQNHSSVGRV